MTLRRVLELRLGGAQAAAKKFKTLLARAGDDDRIRGSLQYQGAGSTGRWSGRGFQPQNLKRITDSPEDVEAAIAEVMRGSLKRMKKKYPRPLSVLGDVTRPAIVAGPGHLLLGADFSAIESRGLARLADEEWKVALYRRFDATGDPADEPYVRNYSHASGIPPAEVTREQRKIGKTMDLACGFGGGLVAYRNFSDEGTDEEVLQLLKGWNDAHPATVKFRRMLDRSAVLAVQNRDRVVRCGRIDFISTGAYLFLVLPSGRRISYPSPELIKDKYGRLRVLFLDNSNGQFKPCRNGLGAYGGLWAENATQGYCRDLLAAALVRLDAAGFRIVLHVHDEIVVEVPVADLNDDFNKKFSRLMTQRPRWALDLPTAADVWSGPRYLKT